MSITHLVSLSGGKDSTVTAILALEQHGHAACRFVFADTGNEHQSTLDYALSYLPGALNIQVHVVRADFSAEFATKRANLQRIADGESEAEVYGKRQFKYHWTASSAREALALLHPTGNPFLDLCMVRGGFPSRKRQYCTEYLKTRPLTEWAMTLIEQGARAVWSWQGVRLDESDSRKTRLQGTGACVRAFEVVGGGLFIHRPILRWTAADVFLAHELAGIEPNPLYRQGMSRVGCMPCINCGKDELREIARRFPQEVERIAQWERLVSHVCRPRSPVSFFHRGTQGHTGANSSIAEVVAWSKTTRGGRQYDLLSVDEPIACASAYGLCE